jgi:hypothetical protein
MAMGVSDLVERQRLWSAVRLVEANLDGWQLVALSARKLPVSASLLSAIPAIVITVTRSRMPLSSRRTKSNIVIAALHICPCIGAAGTPLTQQPNVASCEKARHPHGKLEVMPPSNAINGSTFLEAHREAQASIRSYGVSRPLSSCRPSHSQAD